MKKAIEIPTATEPDSDAGKLEIDEQLKASVISALEANAFINCDKISVRVVDRQVFLEGEVLLKKERTSAQKCIMDIFGISTVINYLTYQSDRT